MAGDRPGAKACPRMAQRTPRKPRGSPIVLGGEGGTAEGDFESCLNWTTRPGHELPVLMAVTNNRFGISTDFKTVKCKALRIASRAIPYGIRCETVDGNDPVVIWNALDRAMRYCRRERRPFLLEAVVSRMHGHSSSSGAQRIWSEADPLVGFEQKLPRFGGDRRRRYQVDEGRGEERGRTSPLWSACAKPEPTR